MFPPGDTRHTLAWSRPCRGMRMWESSAALFVPTYWAMEGLLDVMLLLFTGIFVIIAATRFRFEETKIYVA